MVRTEATSICAILVTATCRMQEKTPFPRSNSGRINLPLGCTHCHTL